jgi:glycosyltransferase involved in cell wall biosynthesis
MRQPRIALVVASLDILGGHAVQALTLAHHLRGEGYEVTLVAVNPRPPRGLSWVRRMPGLRTLVTQALYLPSLRRLRDADVVHVFAASYWSFLLGPAPALVAARCWGKRSVLNYHSGEADDHLTRWRRTVRPLLRMAHALVVPSAYLQGVFARHGYRARVIPNVVDLSRFAYRDRAPLAPHLLSTRNLEPSYRVDDVLEAYALLRPRYPQARLTIAGSGSQEARLRGLAAPLGGVRFARRVEPNDMPGLYDQGDIFVNASIVDNQPLSVLEAFAAGLPVVSTGPGDLPTMLKDGETGLLVPDRDPAALANAVATLLDDPHRALSMARRARHAVEGHSWPHVSAAWATVYAGVGP